MTPMLKTALEYAERGWSVFPVQAGTKYPYKGFKWKEHSTTDKTIIVAADKSELYKGCNWAVDCEKSGIFVLDVDVKPGKVSGLDSLKEHADAGRVFVATWAVATPGGGFHYYFSGNGPDSVGKLGPGLDTRGIGYVLIPDSVNEVGKPYAQLQAGDLTPTPEWISERVQRDTAKKPKREIPMVDPDIQRNIDMAIRYLKNDAPEAIEGSGGDHITYLVACRVRDFGISQEIAAGLMLEHWNAEKAQPPWTTSDIEKKVKNAYAYAKDRPGNATPDVMFKNPLRSKGLIRCAADVDIADIKPRQWLLGYRYIPGYVTLTIAPGGVGKSLLTIAEGLSVASGKSLLYDDVKIKGPVWMFNTEDPFEELERRVMATALHYELSREDIEDFYFTSSYNNPMKFAKYDEKRRIQINEPLVQAFIDEIKKRGIKLLIVDPFVETHSVNENDNTAIADVAQVFRRIASETNCAVSLVHHASQGMDKRSRGNADKARGASSLVSLCRIAHTLYPMSDEETREYGLQPSSARWYIRLDDAKANLAPPSDTYYWYEKKSVKLNWEDEETTGVLQPAQSLVRQRVTSAEDAIVEEVLRLVHPGTARTVHDMAKEIEANGLLNLSYKTIQNKISKLFIIPIDKEGVVYVLSRVKGPKGKPGDGIRAIINEP